MDTPTYIDRAVTFRGPVAFAKGAQVDLGAFASATAGSGFDLGDATSAMTIYSDDGGAALTGDRRGIRSRLLITANHTGALTLSSVRGHVKLAGGVDYDGDYLAGVDGYLEIASTSDFGLNSADHAACAIRARVEAKGNVSIETAGSFLAGVYAELNTGAGITITQTGELAAFVAITTDQKADAWGSVIYVDGADNVFKFASGTAYEDGVKVVDGEAGDAGVEGLVGYDALMRCYIGATAYYIPMFDAGSVTNE